jgi:hypothetical protein
MVQTLNSKKRSLKEKILDLLLWVIRKLISSGPVPDGAWDRTPENIARELALGYFEVKKYYPREDEEGIMFRLWQWWMGHYEVPIRCHSGSDKEALKVVRMDEMEKEVHSYNKPERLRSLKSIFDAVLYVETGLSPDNDKRYINALIDFVNEVKRHDLDYSHELLKYNGD